MLELDKELSTLMTLLIESISKRIFTSVIILFLVISFIFLLIRLSPGDPSQKFLASSKSPELAELVKKTYNLDKPLLTQYISFVSGFIQGNLGYSYNFREKVLNVILNYAPFTIFLSLTAVLFRFIFGFILAYISFKNAGSIWDKLLKKINFVFYASPTFVVGILLIVLFSANLNLFPSSGFRSFNYEELSWWGKLLDYSSHLTLPLLTLVLCGMPLYYLYIRDNLQNENQKDYITYLRSNGFGEKKIFYRHILPNTISPLLAVAGIELGLLFGGALFVEVVFGLPGIGRLTVDAIASRDYPLIVGCCFFAGFMMLVSTMLADLLRLFIDRRLSSGILN